jgi:hypothetical protein
MFLFSMLCSTFLTSCFNVTEMIFGKAKTDTTITATASPGTGRFNAIPSSFEVTFPSTVTMSTVSIDDFSISDTCASATPTLTSVTNAAQVSTVVIADGDQCTNAETVTVTITYALISLSDDTKHAAGSQSFTFTVDTSSPTVSATVGAHSGLTTDTNLNVTSVPTSITYAFSTDADLSTVTSGDFSIVSTGGTDCSTLPTVGTPILFAGAHTAQIPLTGASCNDGESFGIVFAADSVDDATLDSSTGDPAPNTAPASDLQINLTYYDSSGAVSSVGDGSTSATGTYAIDGSLDIIVTMDRAVEVTGTPQLRLALTGTKYADYDAGSSTSTDLVFKYTIVAGDTTTDLDYFSTSSLVLSGGSTITREGSSGDLASTLTLPSPGAVNSLGSNRDIIIDGVAPAVTAHTPAGTTNTWGLSTRDVTFTFGEEMDPSSLADADLIITSGTCAGVPSVSASSLSGVTNNVVTFSLTANTCGNGETYTISFDPASLKDLAGNDGTGSSVDVVVTTDATKPLLSVGAPSKSYVKSSDSLTYVVTFTGATAITMSSGDINFAGASTNCNAVISGNTLNSRTITIDGCSDDGAVQMDIAAGTATNIYDTPADAVAEGDITDFTADNTELLDPTSSLPAVGGKNIYNLDTLSNFDLTFSGDVLGIVGSLQSSISLNCNTGGGANPVAVTVSRFSDTVARISPNEASPDFVYNSNCAISGTNVPDSAGNLHTFSAIDFTVAKTPTALSGPSGTISLATATANGDLGNVVFNHAMDTSTLISANVALTCDGQDIAISSLSPSAGDTTYLIDFDESDSDWTSLVGGEACVLSFSTAATNSLGIPLTGQVDFNFTTSP